MTDILKKIEREYLVRIDDSEKKIKDFKHLIEEYETAIDEEYKKIKIYKKLVEVLSKEFVVDN